MKHFGQRFSAAFAKEKPPKPLAVLISELDNDVNHQKLSDADRDAYLDQLKNFTRTPEDVAPLCTRQGILLLCRHAFEHGTAKTSRTALKCLANVMLLTPDTRQIFVDLGYPPRAAELYKHDYREDEFLSARILFLITYGTNYNFGEIFEDKTQLIDTINKNVARHATYLQSASQKRSRQASVGDAAAPVVRSSDQKALEAAEQMTTMALCETLKLLFNLCNFYPALKNGLGPSLLPCLKMLQKISMGEHPLQPPVTYLINACLAIDLENRKSDLFPSMGTKINVERFIQILDLVIRRELHQEIERSAVPLITLLRRIYEVAPKSIKVFMRALLLPSEKDREKPLGQSDSLSSRLLNLSGSPMAPTAAKGIQEFLFEMSGKDASRFVRNIGYGFASGFLMSHKITVPESALDAFSISDSNRVEELDDEDGGDDYDDVTEIDEISSSSNNHSKPDQKNANPKFVVNPITGQRKDMEESDEEDDRSTEEKMREAERLFTLFERLKATGVMDVENPVAKAAREGRLG